MDIVPTGDKLVVAAKLSPIDRGYVDTGQPALVKVSTYDSCAMAALPAW